MAMPGFPKSAPESNRWVFYLVLGVGSPVWAAYAQNDLMGEGLHLARPTAHLLSAVGAVLGFGLLAGVNQRPGVVAVLSLVWSQSALWATHAYISWRGAVLSRLELLPPLLLAALPVLVFWLLFNHTEESR